MTEGSQPAAPAAALLVTAALLAALTLAQPFAVASIGVMVLGPLHVVLAVRYLLGRAWPVLPGRVGQTMIVFVLAMMCVRAIGTAAGHLGHYLELLGGSAIIAYAMWTGLRGRWRLAAVSVVAAWTAVSLLELPWYWHLLTHGHNVVPLIFLWDWARRAAPRARIAFVAANLVWLVGIPAAMLSGRLDRFTNETVPGVVARLTDPSFLVDGAAPPGADQAMGLRFLTVFAFMQAMHYVLWMVFFQVGGRAEIRRLEQAAPSVAGWRFWAVGAAVSATIWATYAIGYGEGRSLYGVVGALNVTLEQPLAVWLLLTALPAARTTPLVATLKRT